MRKSLVIFLVLLLASSAFGIKRSSLLQERMDVGWYLAPIARVSSVADQTRLFAGGRAGVILDHSLMIGAAILTSSGENQGLSFDPRQQTDQLEITYGGLEIGMIDNSHDLTHLSLGLLVGGGVVDDQSRQSLGHDSFFVMEPYADLMLNLTQKFRLGFGLGYRFAADLFHPLIESEDFSGLTFGLTLKFASP